MAQLIGALVGTFVLSRIFWLIPWYGRNTDTKAITLNALSALVIIPADFLAAVSAGKDANFYGGALLYGGCQFLICLYDIFRLKQVASQARKVQIAREKVDTMQCQYVLQHSDLAVPVKPEECCQQDATEQEPASGRWYCQEHISLRRNDDVAASNGNGYNFSF